MSKIPTSTINGLLERAQREMSEVGLYHPLDAIAHHSRVSGAHRGEVGKRTAQLELLCPAWNHAFYLAGVIEEGGYKKWENSF